MSTELSRVEQLYESMKNLEALDLATKKGPAIKELEKLIKQIGSIDVSKGSERLKITKLFDKINDTLLSISTIDRLLKEKDY